MCPAPCIVMALCMASMVPTVCLDRLKVHSANCIPQLFVRSPEVSIMWLISLILFTTRPLVTSLLLFFYFFRFHIERSYSICLCLVSLSRYILVSSMLSQTVGFLLFNHYSLCDLDLVTLTGLRYGFHQHFLSDAMWTWACGGQRWHI